ncbi:hypothetical protein HYPSUDRAFT_37698 [Hypholoma sublateritium FD-334 SS-4]|uniref:BAH domain-containing protein n=1 Tax=Hypholoma sublateritium (strain FD-334 SS-4) TaxID=945553 RepID=A0A0D2P2U2_HYPSF|nr:hypothetical protein HYPSUDRAFT_37698 [Hypholoma sublateritium FD-334 SS-4]
MPRGRPTKRRAVKATAYAPLTDEKWSSMVPFGTFVITDKDDGTEHKFSKDDIAIILPSGREPGSNMELWEYWVGRIKDIRAEIDEEGTNTVWAKVQWFYSGRDVADVIKSFDPASVTGHERIYADHYDFVESEAFDAVISVTTFNENDPEPPFIARDEFYHRYTFEYKARTLKPKPGSAACTCQMPYCPDDTLPDSIMHFCPRPSCRRAFHQSCLLAGKHKESSSAEALTTVHVKPSAAAPLRSARKHASPIKKVSKTTTTAPPASAASSSSSSASRALRLLACSPDTDDNVDLESLVALTMIQGSLTNNNDDASDVEKPPKKKRRGRPSKNAPNEAASGPPVEVRAQPVRALADTLADLPPLLLQVAQQPMVRGAAFRPGGISGNIGFVTRARRLVYQILEGSSLPEDWEVQVFSEHGEVRLGAENAIVQISGARKPLPLVVCPKCRSAI